MRPGSLLLPLQSPARALSSLKYVKSLKVTIINSNCKSLKEAFSQESTDNHPQFRRGMMRSPQLVITEGQQARRQQGQSRSCGTSAPIDSHSSSLAGGGRCGPTLLRRFLKCEGRDRIVRSLSKPGRKKVVSREAKNRRGRQEPLRSAGEARQEPGHQTGRRDRDPCWDSRLLGSPRRVRCHHQQRGVAGQKRSNTSSHS